MNGNLILPVHLPLIINTSSIAMSPVKEEPTVPSNVTFEEQQQVKVLLSDRESTSYNKQEAAQKKKKARIIRISFSHKMSTIDSL